MSLSGVGAIAITPSPKVAKTIAFITGCGRSGTTILGSILAKHPHVSYLNDRFDLWLTKLAIYLTFTLSVAIAATLFARRAVQKDVAVRA